MPYSAVATVLMLATLMLSISACVKKELAPVVDKRGEEFVKRQEPKAPDASIAYKYQSDTPSYAEQAEVESVHAVDLDASFEEMPVGGTSNEQEKETSLLDEQNSTPDAAILTKRFSWPVEGRISRKYGVVHNGRSEEGIIIKAKRGASIQASASGEVAYVGAALPEYGQMVIIRHEDGFMSSYAHAEEILVGKGQFVNKGEVIAYVGASGFAPEPQLHFTIRSNQNTVNPELYLPEKAEK